MKPCTENLNCLIDFLQKCQLDENLWKLKKLFVYQYWLIARNHYPPWTSVFVFLKWEIHNWAVIDALPHDESGRLFSTPSVFNKTVHRSGWKESSDLVWCTSISAHSFVYFAAAASGGAFAPTMMSRIRLLSLTVNVQSASDSNG